MCRGNSFACIGMGGQLALCIPEKDLLIVSTGDTMGTEGDIDEIIRAVFEELCPALSDAAVTEIPGEQNRLAAMSGNLAVKALQGAAELSLKNSIAGKTFRLEANPLGISEIVFSFDRKDEGCMAYTKQGITHEIRFGFGTLVKGVFPEKQYSGKQIGKAKNEGYAVFSSAAWCVPASLLILVRVMDDYFASLKITAVFDGNCISIRMGNTAEAFMEDYSGFASGTMIR